MYHQIANRAGHEIVAQMFKFIDLSAGEDGRLEAEKVLEAKRFNS